MSKSTAGASERCLLTLIVIATVRIAEDQRASNHLIAKMAAAIRF
jgi:hypothetical protein